MTTDAAPARATRPGWLVAAISVVIGLFYAWVVWNAVDLLIRQVNGPLGLNGYGWFVHLAAVVFPLLAFGGAFALGYRRKAWELALVLLAGLGLSAAFWVNILAYGVTSYSLYGA